MSRDKKVYDISVLLSEESIDFPGDPEFKRDLICDLKKGDPFELSAIKMSTHCGTHLDSPAHFIPDGKRIDAYNISDFIINAHVIDIKGDSILPEDLHDLDIKGGDALLFRTENSVSGICRNGVYQDKYVYMSSSAAQVCVDKKVSLVAIDYASIENTANRDFKTHKILLGNNILILEGINLLDVPAGKYTLICLPLKIKDSEAAPVRALLVGER